MTTIFLLGCGKKGLAFAFIYLSSLKMFYFLHILPCIEYISTEVLISYLQVNSRKLTTHADVFY